MTRLLNWHLVVCCSRRRAPKSPAQEADAFAVPRPSGPSALAFPEFEYVLRARAATEQAQLRGSRERGERLWRDAQGGAEEQQLSAFQAEDTDQPLPEEADYDGRSISIITGFSCQEAWCICRQDAYEGCQNPTPCWTGQMHAVGIVCLEFLCGNSWDPI